MRKAMKLLFFIIGIIGLNPYNQNKFENFKANLALVFCTYAFIRNVLPLFLDYKGIQSVAELYTLPAVFVCLVKLFILYIYNHDLKTLLDGRDSFWADDKFGVEMKERIEMKRKIVDWAIVLFAMMILVTEILFSLLPLFIHDNKSIMTGYEECDMKTSPCFEISHTLQTFVMSAQLGPAFIGFDLLFSYFIGEVYCSLEILKESIRNIKIFEENVSSANQIIREFVDQHCIILEYINKLRSFYNEAFLILALTSLFCYVYTLYTLTADGFPPPIASLMKSGPLFLIFTTEMLYYAMGGTILAEQSESVATEIYNIDWWKKVPPTYRRNLKFIMMRSQKREYLSVGKFADMDREFFIAIMKNALSVYTLLLNMQGKSPI